MHIYMSVCNPQTISMLSIILDTLLLVSEYKIQISIDIQRMPCNRHPGGHATKTSTLAGQKHTHTPIHVHTHISTR